MTPDELHTRCAVHGCTEPNETDGVDPGVSVCLKTHTRSVLRLFSNNAKKKCVFYETVMCRLATLCCVKTQHHGDGLNQYRG